MDYKELLCKYITHVGRVEGSNFISKINNSFDCVKFAVKEEQAIKDLESEMLEAIIKHRKR